MRFGVHVTTVMKGTELTKFAQRAEQLGYDTITVADHVRPNQMSTVPFMAATAMVTERLKVGSLVFGNDYRHPVILARDMSTIDVLSGGRALVGIGAGWLVSDYEAAGFPLDPPGVRIDRLSEAIAVMKGLWHNDSFSFEGKHFQLRNCASTPRPVQSPHPKLMIGAGGPRMLKLAAREADIINLSANQRVGAYDPAMYQDGQNALVEAFDQRVELVRNEAGMRFREIELSSLAYDVAVTDDRDQAVAVRAKTMGVSCEWVLASPMIFIGTLAEIEADIIAKNKRYGIAYWIFFGEQMEQLAPLVARLSTTDTAA